MSESQTKTYVREQYTEPHESHEIFFKTITRNKLNELLNRITTGYLQNQINRLLKGYKVITEIKKCIDIYIKYYDINDIEIGHISFHLDKVNKNMSISGKRKGRLHVKNLRAQKRYYTLRVTHKNDLYNMKVNSPLKMKQDLEYCINITLKILNDYTESQSQYFLGKRLTNLGNKDNECLITIAGPIYSSRFNNTRKKPISNSVSISKQYSKIYTWPTKTYK